MAKRSKIPAQNGMRGRPFSKGQSGNPEGRPKGSRNKATLAAEALLDGQAEAIAAKLVERARDGDMAAIRLCIDRIAPISRRHYLTIDLPPINNALDALKATNAVLQGMARGEISVEDASALMGFIEHACRLINPARDQKAERMFGLFEQGGDGPSFTE